MQTLQAELQSVKLTASRAQGQFEDELQQAGGSARSSSKALPRQRTEFTQIRAADSARGAASPFNRIGAGAISQPSPLLLARSSMRSARAEVSSLLLAVTVFLSLHLVYHSLAESWAECRLGKRQPIAAEQNSWPCQQRRRGRPGP